MTNKEKYKQAFSVLHPSEPISLEVEQMVKIQKNINFKLRLQSSQHVFLWEEAELCMLPM
mgnify:CR=1 FL=1